MIMKGRMISKGHAEGLAIVSKKPISFFGGVDPNTGVVLEKGHDLEGQSVKDRIFVFPNGTGSTVGSYTMLRLRKNKSGPKAIINRDCETIVAVGAIISDTPCVDKVDIDKIKTGDRVVVNADRGEVVVG
jgi:predicted aconitase with swiveling domain